MSCELISYMYIVLLMIYNKCIYIGLILLCIIVIGLGLESLML